MATTTLTAAIARLNGGGDGGNGPFDKTTATTPTSITPRSKRKLQKHLRSSGLAYISRTGKLIPAKKVAEELCQCPQKCDERVPMELRERLFARFYGMGDTDMQNAFLREHMDVRARYHCPQQQPVVENNSGGVAGTGTTGTETNNRSPRRITCKYLVPKLPSSVLDDDDDDDDEADDLDMHYETVDVCQKAFVSAFVITTKRVRLQREKLISSLGLNSYGHTRKENNANRATQPKTNNNNNNNNVVRLDECDDNGDGVHQGTKRPATQTLSGYDLTPKKQANRTNSGGGRRRRFVDDPLIPFGLMMPDSVTIAPVTVSADHVRDIAIVNNFFSNQLWKPEYIQGSS